MLGCHLHLNTYVIKRLSKALDVSVEEMTSNHAVRAAAGSRLLLATPFPTSDCPQSISHPPLCPCLCIFPEFAVPSLLVFSLAIIHPFVCVRIPYCLAIFAWVIPGPDGVIRGCLEGIMSICCKSFSFLLGRASIFAHMLVLEALVWTCTCRRFYPTCTFLCILYFRTISRSVPSSYGRHFLYKT